MEQETKKKLVINCGLVCLLRDQEGILDSFDKITVNCGRFVVSPAIYTRLNTKKTTINSGTILVKTVGEKILQLNDNAVIDGSTDLKDSLVLATDSLIVKGEGLARLAGAEGLIVLGTLYYPASGDLGSLIKVDGKKRPYPDEAQVLLGDHDLAGALAAVPPDAKYLWIDGTLSALDTASLETAKAAGMRIDCTSLFTYEGLYAAYGGLFRCPNPVLVGDDYEITGDHFKAARLPFSGPKVYVNGDFSMDAKDLPLLEALEAIVVRGRATLPVSVAQAFRKKGRAGDYEILEGRQVTINSSVLWGHRQFTDQQTAGTGEKLSVTVNGCLRFDDDVTAEDLDCIASLSCNGAVLLPSHLKGALAPRIKDANGFIGDDAEFEKMTGHKINDYAGGFMNGDTEYEDPVKEGVTRINTGSYILI
ncbi:MAG: hypothetical protein LBD96_06615 [Treponema sp.]|jgi:hypothetical protein|nr:hypothetical protein [Treponema sp.]